MLEIGCGTGRALGHLAERGIVTLGVFLSPVMVERTTTQRVGAGVEFVCAEVLEYLIEHGEVYDAAYSIFEAAWFTDPGRIFSLARQRLMSRGSLRPTRGGDV